MITDGDGSTSHERIVGCDKNILFWRYKNRWKCPQVSLKKSAAVTQTVGGCLAALSACRNVNCCFPLQIYCQHLQNMSDIKMNVHNRWRAEFLQCTLFFLSHSVFQRRQRKNATIIDTNNYQIPTPFRKNRLAVAVWTYSVAVSWFRVCVLRRIRPLWSSKGESFSETLLTMSDVVKCDGPGYQMF